MYNPEPKGDHFGPFQGPLSSEDIERIEVVMNMLVSRLFQDEPERIAEELEADLADKIDAYIGIADLIKSNPDMKHLAEMAPDLGDQLRKLLKLVNEYNVRLN